jgi:2Fe-2S ferredoxin
VTFGDVVVECRDGESLFDAGARGRVPIETACVGKGTCGLCRVRVVSGAEHLSPYTDEELKHLGNVYFITKVRLSCRTRVSGGDVVVELAPKKAPRSLKK